MTTSLIILASVIYGGCVEIVYRKMRERWRLGHTAPTEVATHLACLLLAPLIIASATYLHWTGKD